MFSHLKRAVALAVISCLLADPATVSAFSISKSSFQPLHAPASLFNQQAFATRALEERQELLSPRQQVEDIRLQTQGLIDVHRRPHSQTGFAGFAVLGLSHWPLLGTVTIAAVTFLIWLNRLMWRIDGRRILIHPAAAGKKKGRDGVIGVLLAAMTATLLFAIPARAQTVTSEKFPVPEGLILQMSQTPAPAVSIASAEPTSSKKAKVLKRALIMVGQGAAIYGLARINPELQPLVFANVFNNGTQAAISAIREHRPVFDTVLWGTAAGIVSTSGLEVAESTLNTPIGVLPGKIIQAGGASMQTSIVRGDDPLSYFGMSIGGAVVSYRAQKERPRRFSVGIDPKPLWDTFSDFLEGDHFSSRDSLRLFTPTFISHPVTGNVELGATDGNIIKLYQPNDPSVRAHELIHAFQYESGASQGARAEDFVRMLAPIPDWIQPARYFGYWTTTRLQQTVFSYLDQPIEREAFTFEQAYTGKAQAQVGPLSKGWDLFGNQIMGGALASLISESVNSMAREIGIPLKPSEMQVQLADAGTVRISWDAPERSEPEAARHFIAQGSYTVIVTGPKNFESVKYAGDGSAVVFSGLSPGAYTVTVSHFVTYQPGFKSGHSVVATSTPFPFTVPESKRATPSTLKGVDTPNDPVEVSVPVTENLKNRTDTLGFLLMQTPPTPAAGNGLGKSWGTQKDLPSLGVVLSHKIDSALFDQKALVFGDQPVFSGDADLRFQINTALQSTTIPPDLLRRILSLPQNRDVEVIRVKHGVLGGNPMARYYDVTRGRAIIAVDELFYDLTLGPQGDRLVSTGFATTFRPRRRMFVERLLHELGHRNQVGTDRDELDDERWVLRNVDWELYIANPDEVEVVRRYLRLVPVHLRPFLAADSKYGRFKELKGRSENDLLIGLVCLAKTIVASTPDGASVPNGKAHGLGNAKTFKTIESEVNQWTIYKLMTMENRFNQARDISVIGKWVTKDMTVDYVLRELGRLRDPNQQFYEERFQEAVRVEAVRQAGDGVRISGVSFLIAEWIKTHEDYFHNIDPPFAAQVDFEDVPPARSYTLERVDDVLHIRPEGALGTDAPVKPDPVAELKRGLAEKRGTPVTFLKEEITRLGHELKDPTLESMDETLLRQVYDRLVITLKRERRNLIRGLRQKTPTPAAGGGGLGDLSGPDFLGGPGRKGLSKIMAPLLAPFSDRPTDGASQSPTERWMGPPLKNQSLSLLSQAAAQIVARNNADDLAIREASLFAMIHAGISLHPAAVNIWEWLDTLNARVGHAEARVTQTRSTLDHALEMAEAPSPLLRDEADPLRYIQEARLDYEKAVDARDAALRKRNDLYLWLAPELNELQQAHQELQVIDSRAAATQAEIDQIPAITNPHLLSEVDQAHYERVLKEDVTHILSPKETLVGKVVDLEAQVREKIPTHLTPGGFGDLSGPGGSFGLRHLTKPMAPLLAPFSDRPTGGSREVTWNDIPTANIGRLAGLGVDLTFVQALNLIKQRFYQGSDQPLKSTHWRIGRWNGNVVLMIPLIKKDTFWIYIDLYVFESKNNSFEIIHLTDDPRRSRLTPESRIAGLVKKAGIEPARWVAMTYPEDMPLDDLQSFEPGDGLLMDEFNPAHYSSQVIDTFLSRGLRRVEGTYGVLMMPSPRCAPPPNPPAAGIDGAGSLFPYWNFYTKWLAGYAEYRLAIYAVTRFFSPGSLDGAHAFAVAAVTALAVIIAHRFSYSLYRGFRPERYAALGLGQSKMANSVAFTALTLGVVTFLYMWLGRTDMTLNVALTQILLHYYMNWRFAKTIPPTEKPRRFRLGVLQAMKGLGLLSIALPVLLTPFYNLFTGHVSLASWGLLDVIATGWIGLCALGMASVGAIWVFMAYYIRRERIARGISQLDPKWQELFDMDQWRYFVPFEARKSLRDASPYPVVREIEPTMEEFLHIAHLTELTNPLVILKAQAPLEELSRWVDAHHEQIPYQLLHTTNGGTTLREFLFHLPPDKRLYEIQQLIKHVFSHPDIHVASQAPGGTPITTLPITTLLIALATGLISMVPVISLAIVFQRATNWRVLRPNQFPKPEKGTIKKRSLRAAA